MRNLISILLAISLSWVTTSYACQMDVQHRVSAICCCPQHHAAKGEAEAQTQQASAAKVKHCCDVSSSVSVDQQQPAVASAHVVLDLPFFAVLSTVQWQPVAQVARVVSVLPPVCGPSRHGTRTYLATARLRL